MTKESNKKTRLISFALIAILAGASVLYIAALRENTFGLHHDDGVYVVLAKALATGQGYRIISLPQEPTQTKTPPLYPFLLSLIWRAYPKFPENLTAMMLMSVAATLMFLTLSYRYLVRQGYSAGWQALIVVTLSSINIYTIIFSITVLSDMLCAAISVAGLYVAEKYEKETGYWAKGIVLGIILGLAFLTRSAAIALMVSVGAYYLLRRQWRRAFLAVAVAGVFVIGWAAWCYYYRSSLGGVNSAYYESYFNTYDDVISSLKSQGNVSGSTIFLRLIAKNILGLVLISVPMVSAGFNYYGLPNLGGFLPVLSLLFILLIFFLIAAGFRRNISHGVRLLHIYVVTYLVVHILWPYATYHRFLVPLLPFLLYFLISEVAVLRGQVRAELSSPGRQLTGRISSGVIGLILFLLAGATAYNYGSGMYWSLASLNKIARTASEDAQLTSWINMHTEPSDVLLCERDPVYYLYTGRKATRTSPLKEGQIVEGGQSSINQYEEVIFRIISENNARYLILTRSESENAADLNEKSYSSIVERHPEKFRPVFESGEGRSIIYRIDN